jgi:hypothetical protein
LARSAVPWHCARPWSRSTAKRWPNRIPPDRSDGFAAGPAAVRGLRLCLSHRRGSMRAMRSRSRHCACGDRARSARRRPGGRRLALRGSRTRRRARTQVRAQALSGGHRSSSDAAGAAGPRDRRCRGAGSSRALEMALAGLRPSRGDRNRSRTADRTPPSCLLAPRAWRPSGGPEKVRAPLESASGLGRGRRAPPRPPDRRCVDDRRHADRVRAVVARSRLPPSRGVDPGTGALSYRLTRSDVACEEPVLPRSRSWLSAPPPPSPAGRA